MARSSSRFGLSDVDFIDVDPQAILTSIVAKYEAAAGRSLAVSDPVYLFLESIAAVIVDLRNALNIAGKETTLSYATGGFLDAIGSMINTPRLPASGAQVELRFTLFEALSVSYQVPEGLRVTNGMQIFATDKTLIIPAGETSGEVTATALELGTASNGIGIGHITNIVDPLPGALVTNISVSSGGADVESDDEFANRIALAPESFSAAGPRGAYRYHVLAAHTDIAEVAITTPKPGTVDVRPVLKNGELPTAAILDAVRAALNDESVRPLTDTVIVEAPTIHDYAIEVAWTLAKDDEALLVTVTKQVAEAVESYRLWQRTMPGRDINPTRLISLMEQAGAHRVEVISPVYAKLEATEIARETDVKINFLGTEDE